MMVVMILMFFSYIVGTQHLRKGRQLNVVSGRKSSWRVIIIADVVSIRLEAAHPILDA
jgi:hypothetical protein